MFRRHSTGCCPSGSASAVLLPKEKKSPLRDGQRIATLPIQISIRKVTSDLEKL